MLVVAMPKLVNCAFDCVAKTKPHSARVKLNNNKKFATKFLKLDLKQILIITQAQAIFSRLIITEFVKQLAEITLKPAPTMLAISILKNVVLFFVVICTKRSRQRFIIVFCSKKSSI